MGVGAFTAGIFHVMTHAFFKALLFLGSGSVIHAMHHEQDMMKMGALRKKLPITYLTMMAGTLAIAGIPFFSGFFSKDEILWKAFSSPLGGGVFWALGFLTAGLTSFYMFRMMYLTFHGNSRVDSHLQSHLHESPWSMTGPLMILAVLSIFGGFFGVPHALHFLPNGMELYFHDFFAKLPGEAHGSVDTEIMLMILSVVLALFGWFWARRMYSGSLEAARRLCGSWSTLYDLSLNKWYVDEIYQALIVTPGRLLSTHLLWQAFDKNVIDRSVNGSGVISRGAGGLIRGLQDGVMQTYALIFAIGTLTVIWYIF